MSMRVALYKGLDAPVLMSPEFNGSQGTNRCPALPKVNGFDGQPANSDAEAVLAWINRAENEHTRRQYRKEIERFMLWAIVEQNKPLSSVSITDVQEYKTFMGAPSPRWVGKRVPRGPAWRPFAGPLKPSSIRQAMVIVADCFKWLTTVRYLDFNVCDDKLVKTRQNRTDMKVDERHIPRRALDWILAWLNEQEATDIRSIRWRFGLNFLNSTGLREAEFAAAKMGDVFKVVKPGETMWFIRVTGKGNKVRDVPVIDIQTLMNYRLAMKMSALPLEGEDKPLWIPMRGSVNVKPGAIYDEIKLLLRAASADLSSQAMNVTDDVVRAEMLNDAKTLSKASPHWLRHSFATTAVNAGSPIQIIQNALGHASISTTQIYVTTERENVYRSLATSIGTCLER